MIQSLSGRFLILTIIFVMLAEIMIFVPSIARFRGDYLSERLERAQIASLALLATPQDMVDPTLEEELLSNAGVHTIAFKRDEISELVLDDGMPDMVAQTFDMRAATPWSMIVAALEALFRTEDRLIRVIGHPVQSGGLEIDVTLYEAPMREAMYAYGRTIFLLSLLISVITAALLFFAVQLFMVGPIKRVIGNMTAYRDNPEDATRIMVPDAAVREIRDAENALMDMQQRLSSSLKHKERLAQLGSAVAKISHDLRNMLTTAQLLADRMETSADPSVIRTAPKLVNSLNRAISLCENTLEFGKADEPAPRLQRFDLSATVEEIQGAELLRQASGRVEVISQVPAGMMITADPEHVFRILNNLVRNARQAIDSTGEDGTVTLVARAEEGQLSLDVVDTGPGLPKRAGENLFQPFHGGTRREGTGLGLAIAAELSRGLGGDLKLIRTGSDGTVFRLTLPAAQAEFAPATDPARIASE